MEISEVRAFCKKIYLRFSDLDLHPFQLKYCYTQELVSIALINKKEKAKSEAAIVIDEDSISLLQINNFDDIDCLFIYNSPLDLYLYLLALLLFCCESSGIYISPSEAIDITFDLISYT